MKRLIATAFLIAACAGLALPATANAARRHVLVVKHVVVRPVHVRPRILRPRIVVPAVRPHRHVVVRPRAPRVVVRIRI